MWIWSRSSLPCKLTKNFIFLNLEWHQNLSFFLITMKSFNSEQLNIIWIFYPNIYLLAITFSYSRIKLSFQEDLEKVELFHLLEYFKKFTYTVL